MTHEYVIDGMTCANCAATVKSKLSNVPGVMDVQVSQDPPEATIVMHHHISTTELQTALKGTKYTIRDKVTIASRKEVMMDEDAQKSFFETYKPILLVFAFILGVTLLVQWTNGIWNTMQWMQHFMAGFFIVFSFFKILDLPGFASSYSSYDIIAKKWYGWGFVYPFAELALGILYLTNLIPDITNLATIALMGVSSIGVFQSLMAKRKFKCACLGAIFNVPMSTITLVEDILMVVMAAMMLFIYH